MPRSNSGPFLVVSNHSSPLDILVGLHVVGGVVLSHHGVREIPVIGEAAKVCETIFVDRSDRSSGAKAIRQIRRSLKKGRNVIVFPEGTTFPGDEVRPFKRGVFAAARGLHGVRVLPLGLAYEAGSEFNRESFGTHMLRMTAKPRIPIWGIVGEPQPVPTTAPEEEGLRNYIQHLVDRAGVARHRDALG